MKGSGRAGKAQRREWEGDATLENLPRVRAFVEEACRAARGDERACADLKLAVDEACTNVVEHGYAGTAGTLRLSLTVDDGGRTTVEIADRGRPFDPGSVPPPDLAAGWEDRRVGGLGWHLIRSAVDEVRYERSDDGENRLTLIKRLRPGPSERGSETGD